MRVAIGSDKSGFTLKEAVKQYLIANNIEFDDFGTTDTEHAKGFFLVAPAVAEQIQSGAYDRGIIVCGTGAGMSILANKYKGVYAVACESVYSARMARAINNAQILAMGGWIVAPEMGVKMAEAFLTTDWLQDLEDWRKGWLASAAEQVGKLEETMF
ncbi:MAG: RpiB/LacA/LacB family sugar-phosphate isomerase [Clostridiales bacterium]|nr:RpiB/LacA/LacB family sugar-phosphate isomerase [Clostridiales bacterium]